MVSQNCPAVSQNLLLQQRRKPCFTYIFNRRYSKLLNGSSSQTLQKNIVSAINGPFLMVSFQISPRVCVVIPRHNPESSCCSESNAAASNDDQ